MRPQQQQQQKPWTWVFVAAVALVALAALPGVWPSDVRSLKTRPSDWELSEEKTATTPRRQRRPLVLVAGLSRTGTSSLQQALSALNLTVHHTLETVSESLDFWFYYLNGEIERPNVPKLLDGVDAVSDCWFAHLAPEIVRAYPDTRVILTTREPFDSWLGSYRGYVAASDLYHWHRQWPRLVAARVSRVFGLGHLFFFLRPLRQKATEATEESFEGSSVSYQGGGGLELEKLPMLMDVWRRIDAVVFGSNVPNPLWKAGYDRHNAFVRSLVPENQLLEFSFANGDGWQEIADFLDMPVVPLDQPFPRLNCVATGSCVSQLSARATRAHERFVFASCLLLASFLGLVLYQRKPRVHVQPPLGPALDTTALAGAFRLGAPGNNKPKRF